MSNATQIQPRLKPNVRRINGYVWRDYVQQAQAGCSEVRRHLENLHRIPVGGPIAAECLGISLEVGQIVEAVRALAQIGAANAI